MYTLKQLALDLNMSEKKVGTRLNEVFRLYSIERHWFKEGFSENANAAYAFTEKAYQLIKVLLIALEDYPLVKSDKKIDDDVSRERVKSKLEIEGLQKFYAALIPAIDEIADEEIRLQIKQTPIYQKTFLESEVIERLNSKLKHFLSASNYVSEAARIELWTDLYEDIDGFIYRAYDKSIEREEEFDRSKKKINTDYKQNMKIVGLHNVPGYEEEYRNHVEFYEEERDKKLESLKEQRRNELEYQSLDQFIAYYLSLEGYKTHYENNLINQPKEAKAWKKTRYGEFSPNDIEEIMKKESFYEYEEAEIAQFSRATGLSFEELKKVTILREEKNINQKLKRFTQYFEEVQLSKEKAESHLQNKQENSSHNKTNKIKSGYINMHLKNIESELHKLHEAATSVLYSELTAKEERDVQRVLSLAEHFLGSIDLLDKPPIVRENMEKEFYENYIKFYKRTIKDLDTFNKQSSAFALSTSIEALDNYKTDKSQ